MSKVVNWMIDQLSSKDVIDLYFVMSELVDIPISEAERVQTACYDSLASDTANKHKDDDSNIPLAKRVY